MGGLKLAELFNHWCGRHLPLQQFGSFILIARGIRLLSRLKLVTSS